MYSEVGEGGGKEWGPSQGWTSGLEPFVGHGLL